MTDQLEHGSRLAYRRGCTCDICRTAHRRRCKEYQARAHALGGSTTVDVAPYARILIDLADRMSLSAIGRAIGSSHTYVAKVIRGDIKRISPERAAQIIGLRGYQPTDTSHVRPVGARRRLQALHALGYSWRMLADEVGYSLTGFKSLLRGDFPVIEATRDQAIRETYERLSMRLPASSNKYEQSGITRARKHARRMGWPPPLAWPDDKIDDPGYYPHGWEYQSLDRASALDDLDRMGPGITEVCSRLKVSRDALEKWCARNDMSPMFSRLVARETAVREWRNQHTREAS